MEQKARRKFNVIDIIAVVLILAVLALVGYKLIGKDAETGTANTVHVTYTVKAEGVDASLYETCQKHLPSPLMASGELVGGQIESVREEPYYVLDANGDWVKDPNHVTLYFTASIDEPDEAVMTTKVGDQEVRIGKTDYILKSEYIEFKDVVITDVQWSK